MNICTHIVHDYQIYYGNHIEFILREEKVQRYNSELCHKIINYFNINKVLEMKLYSFLWNTLV